MQSVLHLLPHHCKPPHLTHLASVEHELHGALYYHTNVFTITVHLSCLHVPSVTEDFLEITKYLIDLEKTDVYNLGLVLGLSQHKVKAKKDSDTFLDDIITAWLLKEDQVIKKGEPSWTVLVSALQHRRIGQTGIACKIAKDKGL